MTSVHARGANLQRVKKLFAVAVITTGLLVAPLWASSLHAAQSSGHQTPAVAFTPLAQCGGIVAPC